MKRHQLARRSQDEWARPKPGGAGAGGFSEKEMAAAHKAVMDERELTVRCACGRYRFKGPMVEALKRVARHRARCHPELKPYARGKRAREAERARELARRRGADARKDRGSDPRAQEAA